MRLAATQTDGISRLGRSSHCPTPRLMFRSGCQGLHRSRLVSYVLSVSVFEVASSDRLLAVLAPLALAASRGTALIVDRWPDAGWPFAVGDLGQLAADGPTAEQLEPRRTGVAILGGPADDARVDRLLDALAGHWPAVVVRADPWTTGSAVSVEPALPWGTTGDVSVSTALASGVIPKPSQRLIRHILRGRLDDRWRWFQHWRPLWESHA